MNPQENESARPGGSAGGGPRQGGGTLVDVRDMLCAQALARVAGAIGRVRIGEAIRVLYNADDVKTDLLTWAQAGGHAAAVLGGNQLRIERGALTP